MPATPEQRAEANRLCTLIYDLPEHECGGCWHVVLDDGNVRDRDVEWVASVIAAGGYEHMGHWYPMCKDGPCAELVPIMRAMTKGQRSRVRCSR